MLTPAFSRFALSRFALRRFALSRAAWMRSLLTGSASGLLALTFAGPLQAAPPTASQALQLAPVQTGIPFDMPQASEESECKVEPIQQRKEAGWKVFGPTGQLLRKFVDTNRDNKIDQWCYYRNGIEIYRDIDGDFNGKADQYRWLGTAGSRWGEDKDEDGTIDRWEAISPEEVTAEVVEAIRTRDAARFRRVLLGSSELTGLELGADQFTDIDTRIKAAGKEFTSFAAKQTLVEKSSKWVHFGATQPGVIPAGTGGSKKDLLIYDNVAAVVDTAGKHNQVIIGTLVRVNNGWRVIDLPRSDAAAGLFYTSLVSQPDTGSTGDVELTKEFQALLEKLETLDKNLQSAAGPKQLSTLNRQRADILAQLADLTVTPEDRATWLRQFADSVSAAAQSGHYPEGVARLQNQLKSLVAGKESKELISYVKFRFLTADYSKQLQAPEADFAKIQTRWLGQLESFVKEYPASSDASEAMLQLAIAQEFAGKEREAIRWYRKIVADFADSPHAVKATGAKTRLEAVGKSIQLRGTTLDGRTLDLDQLRGSVVLIHYWASWCEPCKEDMKTIRDLLSKHAGKRFVPVGINLDNERATATSFLRETRLPWAQLHEKGGLDSRLANELGILTLPTMLLIDASGRVVRRNVHGGELEAELEKLLK